MSGPTPTPPLKGRASIGTLLASPLGGRVLGGYSPPRLAGKSWALTRLPAWRASPGRLLASPLGGGVLGGYSPPRLAGESWAVTRLPAWRASPGRLLASPLGGEVLGAYSPPRLAGRVGRGSDCNPGPGGSSSRRTSSQRFPPLAR